MFEKLRLWLILVIAVLLLVFALPLGNIFSGIVSAFYEKNVNEVFLSLVNPEIKSVTADRSNNIALEAEVKDNLGRPVQDVSVNFSADRNLGDINPSAAKTDKYGRCLVSYIPPAYKADLFKSGDPLITLTADINSRNSTSTVRLKLSKVPVVLVHGYQTNGDIFDNMKDFLTSKGLEGNTISFKSENGVAAASKELEEYLRQLKLAYLSKGLQVKKFDVIAHSMGGLVVRYYTCSNDYLRNDDIQKIIFLSVPHKGSPWASIGVGLFKDQGVQDLTPDSPLLTESLPAMINKGLNSTIQVGNLMAQYDEVVSPESASLDEWNIRTEVFNVGKSSFSMDSLLNGSIAEAANHKNVLSNKKVFERIMEMLNNNLPYPAVKR